MKRERNKRKLLISIIYFLSIIFFSFPLFARPIDKAETFTLNNGLAVVSKSLPGSGLVAIQMWVKGGLLGEGEYLGSGISHFIEHMLFKGTEKRGPGKIAEEIHSLGGELNGATSLDYTYYKIILPSEHLDKGLEILSDAIRNSSFSEEEIAREREVILKEINMGEDDPSRRIWKRLFREAFISHPYRESVIGRRAFFESLTRKDLLSFYKGHYIPQYMVLAIAGGVNSDSIKGQVEKYFKDWRAASNFSFPSFNEPAQVSFRKLTEHFPVDKAYIRLGFHIPGIESEDLYPLDLLAVIVGRGRASRLYKEIKEKKGLADTISAFSYTPSSQGIFGIGAITEPEMLDALEEAISQEIEKIKEGEIEEKELQRAKKIIQSEYWLSQEDVEAVASDIAYNKMFLGDADFSKYYVERISQLKRKEVKDIAVKFLKRENLTVCILTPEEKVAHGPASGETKAERLIHCHDISERPVLLTLENRITPMVNLNLLFKGGVICEDREKNGIFSLLSKCLIRSTKKKKYLELHSEIESRGGSLSSYSGYNSFGISLTLPREDLEWGIEILSSLIREPLFKQGDIEKAKEELIARLNIEDDDILTKAFHLFRETIFNQHPYAWRDKGTKETIEHITRRDIISLYEKFCLGQRPVLAIFGDIDEEKTVTLVEKNFRKKGQKKIDLSPFLQAPEEVPSKKNITPPRKQAILVFGFPGVSISNEDRFTIDVITTLLSGQSGRLYTAVREKRGQAYFVGAFQILGLVPGAVVFYTGTTSQNLDEVKKIMVGEIEKLKKEGLPEKEIQKAKENLIGSRRISLQTNSGFGFDSALNELYGLGYNFYIDYEKNIRGVDRDKIRAIARKYFKKEKMSWIIINPKI